MTEVRLSIDEKKIFVFNIPNGVRYVTPCYYPNTNRIELRVGKKTIQPSYIVDEFGNIETKSENVILQLKDTN